MSKTVQSRVIDSLRECWRRVIGDRLDDMMQARRETERFVTDPDPRIREGAFELIAHYWGSDLKSEDVYKLAAMSDPDFSVRAAALSCLARLYYDSGNRAISVTLARIVRDADSPIELREVAYLGLLAVHSIEATPEFLLAICQYPERLPEGVDWDLVDSFLT